MVGQPPCLTCAVKDPEPLLLHRFEVALLCLFGGRRQNEKIWLYGPE
jgi:hypothetical protein